MQIDASEERLSKYELIRLLGAGGMGEVYLAQDTVLRRQVAIKFVSPERVSDAAANARLLQEARAAATLDHPGICPVYDVHTDSLGRTCIVMQYVEGETLSQRLSRGPLDPGEAVRLAAAVADALAAAHGRGVIHRDLKPQNIIVTPDGRPKLLDFGIAQVEVPPEAMARIATTHTATVTWSPDALVGTPAYMSPEQVLRQPIDPRSDLFSLGAVLFECLTGKPAFQAGTDVDTWTRVVYAAAPPPSSVNPAVPRQADAVVARLLAKAPADRFTSASEAAGALRAEAPVSRRASPLPWSRRALLASVCLAIVALAGYGGSRVLRPRALPPPPPQARQWYDKGVGYLRNGAYASAELALKQAVAAHPSYPQALARLAEAQSELDEELDANASLNLIADVVPDTSALPRDEARRLEAVRKLVLRDVDGAAAEYQKISDANPREEGVWLDLARVRQLQASRGGAQAAAQRALQIDPDSAPAHLRMGSLAAEAVDRQTAIREFGEAERLYRAGSDTEGEAEALLQRASFLDAIGDAAAASRALDAAERIIAVKPSPFQQVRASLLRSSLMGSKGDFAAARRIAEDALETARANNLDTVAANALIQVGMALLSAHDPDGELVLKRAISLAERHGAKRVAAQGKLQLAAIYLDDAQTAQARALATGTLDFLVRGQYRRLELLAKSIIGRSLEDTDIRKAEQMARELLAAAESLADQREVAVALENLAGPATDLGSLPEAVKLRLREEQLHREQNDIAALAYDLTNRAELQIRLGRFAEAEEPLEEIEQRAAAGTQAFVRRLRRVSFLRALAAAERYDHAPAARYAAEALGRGGQTVDAVTAMSEAIQTQSQAASRRRGDGHGWSKLSPALMTREVRYWRSLALLTSGDAVGAAAQVDAALADIKAIPSAEFEWRMAAIGAAAARQRGDGAAAAAMTARAQAAIGELRRAWKADAALYEQRADLVACKRGAGIS